MDTENLGELASRSRFMREAGTLIIMGSAVLALFLFIPLAPREAPVALPEEAPLPDPYERVVIEGKAAIVYDLATNTVLYEKNADAQLPLASLTKLLTVTAALTTLSLDMPITITSEDKQVASPHRFKTGDTILLKDLARVTLTASLNDGAAAIIRTLAERTATTTEVALQSASAILGLSSTYAVNGNGLDISQQVAGGYGSARDMATLAGSLLAVAPDIALATTARSADAITEDGKHYQILNTNPTVENVPRLLLSKTGFTDLAGGNLAIVFDAAFSHPIAVVVLGSTETARFTDTNALVAATLAHFSGIESL